MNQALQGLIVVGAGLGLGYAVSRLSMPPNADPRIVRASTVAMGGAFALGYVARQTQPLIASLAPARR